MLALSKIPYLIDALRNWAMDSHNTPQLVVETNFPGVYVPPQATKHADNGVVVLNIHDRAIDNFDMNNERIQFATRFSGQVHHVHIPIQAIVAIYSREQHDGIVFRPSQSDQSKAQTPQNEPTSDNSPIEKKVGKPHLQLVK